MRSIAAIAALEHDFGVATYNLASQSINHELSAINLFKNQSLASQSMNINLLNFISLSLDMIFNLSQTNSIANTFIAELRDEVIQKDSMRFRKNLERLGAFFAYEISKSLNYQEVNTQTPLGIAKSKVLKQQPVLATILRAGLPMQNGLLSVFDQADCAFITAYRKTKKSGDFIIQMEHISTPDLEGKTIILADPMLATGSSIVLCARELINQYQIEKLHIVSAIASTEGVKHVRANLPKADLWLGAIDDEMTSKSYIVPGLGDAGDLAYGNKA